MVKHCPALLVLLSGCCTIASGFSSLERVRIESQPPGATVEPVLAPVSFVAGNVTPCIALIGKSASPAQLRLTLAGHKSQVAVIRSRESWGKWLDWAAAIVIIPIGVGALVIDGWSGTLYDMDELVFVLLEPETSGHASADIAE